ncbi:hypothetical protein [uncultured Erythrobacter sp.]|uniref:hypothetical protein n=1 Tax=uncultured Erythrobacter sp. TaxID=263913 RepID=UPI002659BA2F|nr:hypothetical protein [uncultured Erythrobacter sp.]
MVVNAVGLKVCVATAFGCIFLISCGPSDETDGNPKKLTLVNSNIVSSEISLKQELLSEYNGMKSQFIHTLKEDGDQSNQIGRDGRIWVVVCDSSAPFVSFFSSIGGHDLVWLANVFARTEYALTPEGGKIAPELQEKIKNSEALLFNKFFESIEETLKKDRNYLRNNIEYSSHFLLPNYDSNVEQILDEYSSFALQELDRLKQNLNKGPLPSGVSGFSLALECGGSGFAEFDITARPKPTSLSLIGVWGASVCRAQGRELFDFQACNGWRRIAVPTTEVVGSYYYVVNWSDGTRETGEIQFEGRREGLYKVEISPEGVRYSRSDKGRD